MISCSAEIGFLTKTVEYSKAFWSDFFAHSLEGAAELKFASFPLVCGECTLNCLACEHFWGTFLHAHHVCNNYESMYQDVLVIVKKFQPCDVFYLSPL